MNLDTTNMKTILSPGRVSLSAFVSVAIAVVQLSALAQTFDSGSNGSDGALDFTAFAPAQGAPEVVVTFDPGDPKTFDHPTTPKADRRLDADGDNTYHFTAVTIPAGVVVRLSAGVLGSRPVVWLASGDITIAGKIDLNGSPGADAVEATAPALAGAGGYGGGHGGTVGGAPATRGRGPGGGLSGPSMGGGGAGHAVAAGGTEGGVAYGNPFLLPLWGGSGGAAGIVRSRRGGGGGAGGGALLLASSSLIAVGGAVAADGGRGGASDPSTIFAGGAGGGGSGGAIRLIANRITGNGSLSAQGGAGGGSRDGTLQGFPGAAGRLRLEVFFRSFTGSILGAASFGSAPGPVVLPANAPMVRVQSIAGTTVAADPRGNPSVADVSISEPTQASIVVEAQSVPVGTVVSLTIDSDSGARQTIQSTALEGTLAKSTATAAAAFPAGVSRIYLSASWPP